jgi:hypothetical protein
MSSRAKASLTKVISGPLSQVTKPMMKNRTPMMIIGTRLDGRVCSTAADVDDMGVPPDGDA